MKNRFLDNKVAVITGASQGIGRSTAIELAKNGAKVVLASRNKTALKQVCQEVESLGGGALVIPTDVTILSEVENLISKTIEQWGKIDILISNAGVYYRSPCQGLEVPLMEQSMAVNFYGGLYIILSVLPHMLAKKSGHIILVSTLDSYLGLPGDAPYAAAKGALTTFGDVLRQDLYGSGVFVTTLVPGRVDTPFIDDLKLPRISMIIPPERVASAIISAIKKRPAIVILPYTALLLYFIRMISPRLADWIIRTLRIQGWERTSHRGASLDKSEISKKVID